MRGGLYLLGNPDVSLAAWLPGAVAIASGACLVAGFLTPGAGIAAAAGVGAIVAGPGAARDAALSADLATAFFVIADAGALVLLGPGSMSLDARLFGRREIVIPREAAGRPDR